MLVDEVGRRFNGSKMGKKKKPYILIHTIVLGGWDRGRNMVTAIHLLREIDWIL